MRIIDGPKIVTHMLSRCPVRRLKRFLKDSGADEREKCALVDAITENI